SNAALYGSRVGNSATLLSMDRAWVTQQRCSLWIAALGIDAESTNCFNGKILFYLGFQFVD
ncbi:hypothetical protein, partial [Leptospira kirschneri]|uniref:hypothetical protein n=1 Tax=Leptospira kirschneri TaxID=29507 RepID=UPI001C4E24D9